MLYLNTRGRLPNAGMDARPSPQMSKPFAFFIYPFLWVLATFRPANQQDACTVRVEMMLIIITFWKTCSRCKKKGWSWIAVLTQKLCQLDLKTLWDPHLHMCLLLKPTSFQHSVLWGAGKKKVWGSFFWHVSAHEGSSHILVLVP